MIILLITDKNLLHSLTVSASDKFFSPYLPFSYSFKQLPYPVEFLLFLRVDIKSPEHYNRIKILPQLCLNRKPNWIVANDGIWPKIK